MIELDIQEVCNEGADLCFNEGWQYMVGSFRAMTHIYWNLLGMYTVTYDKQFDLGVKTIIEKFDWHGFRRTVKIFR